MQVTSSTTRTVKKAGTLLRHFSSRASTDAKPAPPSNGQVAEKVSRGFSTASNSGSSNGKDSSPGTDYLTLFQSSQGNALTGVGAYTPGMALKVYPLPRFVLKEDIMTHVRGSNVQPENVKLVYNTAFRPDYVQFDIDSASTQRQITKRLQERGRLGCKFLRAEVSPPVPFTFVDASLKDSPRGRTLLMYNVSANTDYEDIERFFSGYDYDPSHIRIIKILNKDQQVQSRLPRRPVSYHVAVGFTSKIEALRALREKMGDVCANVAVNLRFIQ